MRNKCQQDNKTSAPSPSGPLHHSAPPLDRLVNPTVEITASWAAGAAAGAEPPAVDADSLRPHIPLNDSAAPQQAVKWRENDRWFHGKPEKRAINVEERDGELGFKRDLPEPALTQTHTCTQRQLSRMMKCTIVVQTPFMCSQILDCFPFHPLCVWVIMLSGCIYNGGGSASPHRASMENKYVAFKRLRSHAVGLLAGKREVEQQQKHNLSRYLHFITVITTFIKLIWRQLI